MQVIILVAVILLSWSWLMGPEARANMAPFDPNDPRFAPKDGPQEDPKQTPEDKGTKKNNAEKKAKKNKPTGEAKEKQAEF